MTTEYLTLLAAASARKLRSKALLASGAENWEAAVQLRQAAQIHERMLALSGDDQGRLENAEEAIALYLEAGDPITAQKVASEYPTLGNRLMPSVKRAIHRLHEITSAIQAVAKKPGTFEGVSLDDAEQLARAFPGLPQAWWVKYRSYEHLQQWTFAAESLARGIELAPTYHRFKAMWLHAALKVDTLENVARRAQEMYSQGASASGEFNHMMSVVVARKARLTQNETLFLRARELSSRAIALSEDTPSAWVDDARVFREYLDSRIQGIAFEPGAERLRSAGLPPQPSGVSVDPAALEDALVASFGLMQLAAPHGDQLLQ